MPVVVARLLTATAPRDTVTAPRDEDAVYEAVLREFAHPEKDDQKDTIFISIEGHDPDPAWLKKFAGWPVPPLPASRAVRRAEVPPMPLSMESPYRDSATGQAGYICNLDRVEWRWPDGAAVKVENHLGGGNWVFRWQGGRWKNSGYEGDWIS